MITSSPVAEPANSTSVGEKLLAVGQQMGNTTCKAPTSVDRGGTLGSAPRGWPARGGWRPARV